MASADGSNQEAGCWLGEDPQDIRGAHLCRDLRGTLFQLLVLSALELQGETPCCERRFNAAGLRRRYWFWAERSGSSPGMRSLESPTRPRSPQGRARRTPDSMTNLRSRSRTSPSTERTPCDRGFT